MLEIRQTAAFAEWMANLRDIQSRAVIARRIERMASGNFGDHKSVGEGVSELRVPLGPGYRVYYTQRGRQIVILLCAGDKSSQRRDINKAKLLAQQLE
ncbi:type II toxin-antitoxin system RelE/ParE family toxin [Stenotrophobium rhamnosiphilum]|uniref:Addiction module antitoxin RelB n=1 Tax=Stenotrophobium rhamnosiphilum TaxID=2029166 RepID=A0A2T5ML35_9GAMM|nr:type II toxin-antitoxin system RelE/ParE family toxin [Stenotrophobium rhamnosiphilum]PTU33293.1 addiction module antitoxin RelB [Stenotrophobium rhamnosiphilum]